MVGADDNHSEDLRQRANIAENVENWDINWFGAMPTKVGRGL
jgi:hypothetical protein